MFVSDLGGTEYGLSLQTGSTVFTGAMRKQIEASAAVAAGTLYLAAGAKLDAYAP